jgi:8-oxo-dGTP diphosphatase
MPVTHREVAAAILIGACGRLLFQQRDDKPEILYPGRIGLFGGHRQGNETFLGCVQREVHEEIDYLVPAGAFEPLVACTMTPSDGRGLKGEFFLARGIPVDRLVISEGSLLLVEEGQVPSILYRMSPSSCYVAKVFLEKMESERQAA